MGTNGGKDSGSLVGSGPGETSTERDGVGFANRGRVVKGNAEAIF
jgi:hypothetical protein